MADIGNLTIKLLLDTPGFFNSMKNPNDALDKLAKKAASIRLGFDEASVSRLTSQLNDIVGKLQAAPAAGLTEAVKNAAAAQRQNTEETKQQVSLVQEESKVFTDILSTLRGMAEANEKIVGAKSRSLGVTVKEKEEEQKAYDITRLREKAEEKKGALRKEEASVLKRLEAIEKSFLAIDQQRHTSLSKGLHDLMRYGGITTQQMTVLESVITRISGAQQRAEKAEREAAKAARERAAAEKKRDSEAIKAAREKENKAKRQAQLQSTIIRLEAQLLNVDQSRLKANAQILVEKLKNRTITQEEANILNALLNKERALLTVEKERASTGRTIFEQLKSYLGMYVSVFGAVHLIRNLIRITGEFEAQHVALRAILQDVAGADRIFYQLQELAVKSPFTFKNLTEYAKQLSAFSVPMDEIYDTTKRLADVSAGLGVDMSRIILAYGQIRSASFLRGQEVRQLTEAGIPVLQELAKQFSDVEGKMISAGEVFDRISARQVPFEMVEKMFNDLTSEGGKFYQMQETLAETVKGKVSNLQDAWEIMLSKVGEDNDKFIKGVLNGVTNLIKNYKELAHAIELAAIAYGTYRVACIAATQAQAMQGLVAAATEAKISALSALFTRFAISIRSIPKLITGFISKLNPTALAISAVTTVLAALFLHHRKMTEHIREADKVTKKAIATAEASKSTIHYYIQRLKEAKEGTDEYNRAQQAVIDNAGNFISAEDKVALSLGKVDEVWVNICKHIDEATKLQAMQSVTADASARKQKDQLDVMEELADYQLRSKLSNETRMSIAEFIRGDLTEQQLRARIGGEVARDAGGYYAPGSMSDVVYRAKQWKTEFDKANKIYDQAIRRAQQNMDDLYGTGEQYEPLGPPAPLMGWRGNVSKYLKGAAAAGGTRGLKVSEETNLADFVKDAAKQLNEAREALELIPKTEKEYKKTEEDIKFYERLSEIIYGTGNTEFGNTTKKYKSGQKDADEARREMIQDLQQQFQDLKEIKKWYDALKKIGMSDKDSAAFLASFGMPVPVGGFDAAFDALSTQFIKYGEPNAAQDVQNYKKGRSLDNLVNSAEALKKYTEAVEDLQAKTKNLKLTGFAQELDKIIVDTDSKNRQLQTDWDQKWRELEENKEGWKQKYEVEHANATAEEVEAAWKKFYDDQVKMAQDSIDTQVEYNRKVAQEQINDKANAWVEEMMKAGNIDMSNMDDKSLGQMNVLISRLRGLIADGALAALIPAELLADAENLKVTFDELLSNIEKIINTKVGDVEVEKMKKILDGVSSGLGILGLSADTDFVKDAFANYTEKVKEFGKDSDEAADALNSLKWGAALAGTQALASGFDQLGQSISKVGAAKGDESLQHFGEVLSEVSKGVSSAANAASIGFAIGGPAGAAIGAGLSIIKSVFESILNAVAKAAEYNRKIEQANYDWAQSVRKVRDEYELLQKRLDTLFGSATMAKMKGWADILRKQGDAMKNFNAQALGNQQIKTKDVWLFGWFDEYTSLKDLVPELFKNGGLDYDYLSEFIGSEFFNQLPLEYQRSLNEMQAANEQFIKAEEQMISYLSGILGDMSSSVSEAIMTNFDELGEAAFDTDEILSQVARNFVKNWTDSFLMTNYLSSLSDSITSVWKDQSLSMDEQVAQSLGLVQDSLVAMQDSMPAIQRFYEGIEDQFGWAQEAGESAGDAIKTALVEQNSGLIAAYMNEIRGKLAMQSNELLTSISPAVENINANINSHLVSVLKIEGYTMDIRNRLLQLTTSGSGVKMNTRI